MKKKVLLIVLFLTMTLLFSCEGKVTRETDVLAICSSYAAPGMIINDMKGMPYKVNILDRDNYGRILFEHKGLNDIRNKDESVYVVCQRYDEDYVYYYEDICYVFDDGDYDLEALKKQNDWNCLVDNSKMSRRKYGATIDYCLIRYTKLDWYTISDAYRAKESIDDTEKFDFFLIDYDPKGNELCYAKHRDGTNYFVFSDTDYNISVLEDNGDGDYSDLVEFKKENNWVYGYTE